MTYIKTYLPDAEDLRDLIEEMKNTISIKNQRKQKGV